MDRQPRRHCVPAARGEQAVFLGRQHRLSQIDAADRPARSLADAVFVDGNDDGRATELFLQPSRDDADHAGMPAFARDHRDGAGRGLGGDQFGACLNLRLDRAALLVQPVEFLGDRLRFCRVGGGQQPHAEVGLADAPARIDPRAEREAQIGAGRRAGQARCLDQRVHADVAALRHDFQPLRDEGAVEAAQLGDVGDRAQSNDVEQVDQPGFGAAIEPAPPTQGADQRGTEQEGDADRRQMPVRGPFAFVEAVGVDQGQRPGKFGGAFVVIDDDHIGLRFGGHVERLERLSAAIDGDDQVGAVAFEPDERFARGAVSLHQPVGDIGAGVVAELADQQDEERGGGRAVDVVIAEHHDGFARRYGVGQPLGGTVHVAKDRRVGHEAANRRGAVRVEVFAGAAAGQQQLGNQVVGRETGIARIGREPAPVPGLAEDRAFDVEDEAGHGEACSGWGGEGQQMITGDRPVSSLRT